MFFLATPSAEWRQGRSGLPSNLRVAEVSASQAVALFRSEDGSLFRSTDNGVTWSPAAREITLLRPATSCVVVQSSFALFGAAGGELYRSFDAGGSWQRLSSFPESCGIHFIGFAGELLVVGSASGAYTSANNGATWQLAIQSPGRVVGVCALGSAIFIATDEEVGVVRSTDGGKTWRPFNAGLNNVQGFFGIRSLGAHGGVAYLSVRHPGLNFEGEYRFEQSNAPNAEESWRLVSNAAPAAFVSSFDSPQQNGGGALYALYASGEILQIREGASPRSLGAVAGARALASANDVVFVGTNAGAFRGLLSLSGGATTSVRAKNARTESTARTLRVAPHPATGEFATARFTLPAGKAFVRLVLLDILGRVASVAEESHLPAGEAELTLRLAGMPRGVYAVELFVNDERAARTLLLKE